MCRYFVQNSEHTQNTTLDFIDKRILYLRLSTYHHILCQLQLQFYYSANVKSIENIEILTNFRLTSFELCNLVRTTEVLIMCHEIISQRVKAHFYWSIQNDCRFRDLFNKRPNAACQQNYRFQSTLESSYSLACSIAILGMELPGNLLRLSFYKGF